MTKAHKLAALLKNTARKLIAKPRSINKELKKLALTLPLMALLVEEVQAAQEKLKLDPALSLDAAVFPDEEALAEFIEEQALDQAQVSDIEQELEDVLLAQAEMPKEEDDRKGALLEPVDSGTGAQIHSIDGTPVTVGAAAGDAPFELSGAALLAAAPLPVVGGVVAAGLVLNNLGGTGATAAVVDVPVVTQADGTHLASSLKDLQQLGVDYVDAATGQNTLNVDLGTGAFTAAGLPFFGDANRSGSLTEAEDAALSVNLIAANASQLHEIAGSASSLGLAAHGVDNVRFNLASQDDLNALLASSTFAADLAAVNASGLTLDIDMNTTADVHISQAQAQLLIDHGVTFAANDQIVVDAQTTHLQSTLKDLQGLGVDTVALTPGQSYSIDATDGALTDAAALHFTPDATVTLNTSNAGLNSLLSANISGVDYVDLAGSSVSVTQSQVDGLSEAGWTLAQADDVTMDVVFENGISNLSQAQAEKLHTVGVDHLNFGNGNINQGYADLMLANQLSFTADNDITLAVEGTHLSTSLADLQTLGVDHVSLTLGGTPEVANADFAFAVQNAQSLAAQGVDQIDWQSNSAWISFAAAQALTNADIKFAAEDQIDLRFTNQNATQNLADFVYAAEHAADLKTLGVDHFDAGTATLNTARAASMISAGVDFVDGNDITLVSQATYVASHVSDLQTLGVDHITLNGGPSGTDFTQLQSAADALTQAGLNHINLFADQFASLDSLSTLDNLHTKGIDFNVNYVDTRDLNAFNHLITLYNGTDRTETFVQALTDAGIAHINVLEGNSEPYWSDRLATALHDAGILTAAPAATVVVDAANSPVLTTTAKAMAALGVDGIDASRDTIDTTSTLPKVFIGLGTDQVSEIQGILQAFTGHGDLFSAGTDGALVVHSAVADAFTGEQAGELLAAIQNLGFTELDVITADSNNIPVVDAYRIVAQTTGQAPTVQLIGSSDADHHDSALDSDILRKLS
jgi:hypothetical protein